MRKHREQRAHFPSKEVWDMDENLVKRGLKDLDVELASMFVQSGDSMCERERQRRSHASIQDFFSMEKIQKNLRVIAEDWDSRAPVRPTFRNDLSPPGDTRRVLPSSYFPLPLQNYLVSFDFVANTVLEENCKGGKKENVGIGLNHKETPAIIAQEKQTLSVHHDNVPQTQSDFNDILSEGEGERDEEIVESTKPGNPVLRVVRRPATSSQYSNATLLPQVLNLPQVLVHFDQLYNTIQPTIQSFTAFDDEPICDESGAHAIAFQPDTSTQFISTIFNDPSKGAPTLFPPVKDEIPNRSRELTARSSENVPNSKPQLARNINLQQKLCEGEAEVAASTSANAERNSRPDAVGEPSKMPAEKVLSVPSVRMTTPPKSGSTPNHCANSGVFPRASPACDEAVPFTLTLDVDLKSIGDTEAFKRHVIKDVATAAKIDAKHVKVTALRAGSVMVDMLIAKEAGDVQEIMQDLKEQLKFSNSLLMQGKVTFTAKAASPPCGRTNSSFEAIDETLVERTPNSGVLTASADTNANKSPSSGDLGAPTCTNEHRRENSGGSSIPADSMIQGKGKLFARPLRAVYSTKAHQLPIKGSEATHTIRKTKGMQNSRAIEAKKQDDEQRFIGQKLDVFVEESSSHSPCGAWMVKKKLNMLQTSWRCMKVDCTNRVIVNKKIKGLKLMKVRGDDGIVTDAPVVPEEQMLDTSGERNVLPFDDLWQIIQYSETSLQVTLKFISNQRPYQIFFQDVKGRDGFVNLLKRNIDNQVFHARSKPLYKYAPNIEASRNIGGVSTVPSPRSERARCSCWKYLKRALEKLEKVSKVRSKKQLITKTEAQNRIIRGNTKNAPRDWSFCQTPRTSRTSH